MGTSLVYVHGESNTAFGLRLCLDARGFYNGSPALALALVKLREGSRRAFAPDHVAATQMRLRLLGLQVAIDRVGPLREQARRQLARSIYAIPDRSLKTGQTRFRERWQLGREIRALCARYPERSQPARLDVR